MTLTFAETYNMIAYLTKSDASEGFNQIIDFLNGSSIKYALIVNPNIYVSCIKQFCTTVVVNKVNDVLRLEALVDKKKVVVIEATIREALHLDDAEGVESQEVVAEGDAEVHGEEVNTGDAAEGDVSAAHGEVPTDDEEPSVPSPTPPTPPPQPYQDILFTSQVQPTPTQSPQVQPPSPQPQPQPQPQQDAGIPMNLLQDLMDTCTALTRRVEHFEFDKVAQAIKITKLKQRVKKLERRNKVRVLKLRRLQNVGTTQRVETFDETMMDDVSNQERMIAEMDQDADVVLVDDKEDDREEDESEPAEVQELVDVVTITKIITEVTAASETITAASTTITTASTTITAAKAQVPAATLTAAPTRVTAAHSKRRKRVVIRDLQEESTTSTIIPAETKSKDKGKGISVEEPKPLKKKQQIEQDGLLSAEGDVSAAHGEVPTDDEEPSVPPPTPPTTPPQPSQDIPFTSQRVKKLKRRNKVRVLKLRRLQKVGTTQRVETFDETVMDDVSNQGRMIAEMDQDANVVLVDDKEDDREVVDAVKDVQDAKEDESKPAEVQEVVDVVTISKIITEVVTAVSETITAVSTTITAAEAQVLAATLTPAPTRVTAAHTLKRKPKNEAQARKNMLLYLKNVAGFKMDYFKGMSYDDIRPIFEAKFNSNVAFLLKTKEQIEEDENRALKRLNETLAERAAKRQKLDEEVEELKRHLQIVPNKDDDVYTEATPLARKVPVVDYQIIELNNKPCYKIIRADDTHQLYSCLNLEELKKCTWSSTERKYPLTRFTLDQMLNAVRLKVEEESEVSLELLRLIRQQHQEGQLE
nr:hypothetical protein [Tanacetum cinerariifolium]